jgi:hypothetical protein
MFDKLEKLIIEYDWKVNKQNTTAGWRSGVYSLSVGKTYHWCTPGIPLLPTRAMNKDRRIYDECKNLFPDFDFEMIIINKNTIAPPHRDKNNIGKSLIIGFGDYNYGNLLIEDNSTKIVEEHCIYWSPLYFDGKNDLHWNEEFIGNRYSIILGNSKVLRHKSN